MAESTRGNKRRAAALANLMSLMRRSPEVARLMILLLVWGHVRASAGTSTLHERPLQGRSQVKGGRRRKRFSLKRPRERFL